MYDFKIGNYKIQEKVCGKNGNYVYASICKCLMKPNGDATKQPYKKGDNDFYWLHVKDTKTFYVVPELKLINGGIIATSEQKGMKMFNLTDSKLWLENYEFNYDTIKEEDNKNRLLNLFAKLPIIKPAIENQQIVQNNQTMLSSIAPEPKKNQPIQNEEEDEKLVKKKKLVKLKQIAQNNEIDIQPTKAEESEDEKLVKKKKVAVKKPKTT